jgi:hypothetical protein
MMGEVPDAVVAELAGVHRTAVGQYRRRHGIAAFDAFRHGPRRRPTPQEIEARRARPPLSELLDPFAAEIGMVSDGEIAARAGVRPSAVVAYRAKHGILAYDGHRGAKARRVKRASATPEPEERGPRGG